MKEFLELATDYQSMAELSGILCAVVSILLQIVFRIQDRHMDSQQKDHSIEGARGARESAIVAAVFIILAWVTGYSESYSTRSAQIFSVLALSYVVMFLFWTSQNGSSGRYSRIKGFCLFYSFAMILLSFLLR